MLVSLAAATIACTAIHERLNENNQLVQNKLELRTITNNERQVSLEADLDGHFYSLRGNPQQNEFLVFITRGPEYTQGVVANASFNGAGELRVSMVDNTTVHKIVCRR